MGQVDQPAQLTPFMAHHTPVGKYILQNVDQLTPLDMAHHTPVGI